MKKISKSTSILVSRALEAYRENFKAEIKQVQESGKNPLFTEDYVDMIVDEAKKEIVEKSIKIKNIGG